MEISFAREGQQQIAMEEQIELAGKRAVLPEHTLRYGSEFPVSIREPTDDQARIRIPGAPEQNPIQYFGHFENAETAKTGPHTNGTKVAKVNQKQTLPYLRDLCMQSFILSGRNRESLVIYSQSRFLDCLTHGRMGMNRLAQILGAATELKDRHSLGNQF